MMIHCSFSGCCLENGSFEKWEWATTNAGTKQNKKKKRIVLDVGGKTAIYDSLQTHIYHVGLGHKRMNGRNST